MSMDNVVIIATRLHAVQPRTLGSIPCNGKKCFSPPSCPEQLWGSPSLLYDGYRGIFRESNESQPESYHSLQSSAEVKNV